MELTEKQQEIYEEYQLFLKKCTDMEEDDQKIDTINSIVNRIYSNGNESDSKTIFDFTEKKELESVIEIIKATDEFISNNQESELDKILDTYQNYVIAKTFKQALDYQNTPSSPNYKSKNRIYFGGPGTGKSYYIDNSEVKNSSCTRITFHPDTDYSSFVGCYKPCQSDDEKTITYKYVPQAFITAYVNAWKSEAEKPYYLIIEEINRGNCAQIFGDIFQLLDRNTLGLSEYAITPDKDLQKYLAQEFKNISDDCELFNEIDDENFEEIRSGEKMRIPKNMFILATMNTSDQSLFPIDSAFKRRWDWEYVNTTNVDKGFYILVKNKYYNWAKFLNVINERIEKVTDSEDKQLGYFFVKPNESKRITCEQFVSKVIFYLWYDIFKDYGKDSSSPFYISKGENTTYLKFKSFYNYYGKTKINEEIIIKFLDNLDLKEDEDPSKYTNAETPTGVNVTTTRNSPSKIIRVQFADGTIIMNQNVTTTYKTTIEKIGVEKVRSLNIMRLNNNLIPTIGEIEENNKDKYCPLANGLYLYKAMSTIDKHKLLQTIIEQTNTNATNELVDKNDENSY